MINNIFAFFLIAMGIILIATNIGTGQYLAMILAGSLFGVAYVILDSEG